MRRWQTIGTIKYEDVVGVLLKNRGLKTKKQIHQFLDPPNPYTLNASHVGINTRQLRAAITRIKKAIKKKESTVVYADYDADGVTAGAILWETLHKLGALVMPYIPHRVEEGYGLSLKGIDAVKEKFNPTLLITVDHGITAKEKVAYAQKLGMDVIVSDHHVRPNALPACTIVHTTKLSGAGIAWFLAKELTKDGFSQAYREELLALAAMGIVADMVPLVGPSRTIVRYGLEATNRTKRVGLLALIRSAGLLPGSIGTYEVSHILAPRLNAMGRVVHAIDALRLLCTNQKDSAAHLAQKLGATNRERQQMTEETTVHAMQGVALRTQGHPLQKKLIFISHEAYNQGVIGLVAGKLVEQFYRPSIVVAKGEVISKASARSVAGFNIVEAIRRCSDMLVDVGGHPMAAGFTVETRHLPLLQQKLEALVEKELDDDTLARVLRIDTQIPLALVTEELWKRLRDFEPFGIGNPEPVFATNNVKVIDARLVGSEGKHLKMRLMPFNNVTIEQCNNCIFDAIAFGMGNLYGKLRPDRPVDIAYTIDMDTWNGDKRLQLKIKDIHIDKSLE